MSDHLPATTSKTLTPAPLCFSREDQTGFIDALSEWGNVGAAARAVGVSRTTVYRMRRACPRFARMWDAALLLARPQVEAVLADRALNGVEEVVYYHGEEVAVRRRYDARLLLAHLGRLDNLQHDREVRETARYFNEGLVALIEADEIAFVDLEPPARGQAGAQSGAESEAGDHAGDREGSEISA